MRILEVESPAVDSGRLMALSQFLIKRAGDTNAKKQVSYATFKNLAQAQDIPITKSQLKAMMLAPPLDALIADVTGPDSDENVGEVIFRGGEDTQVKDVMTPDQAEKTVDQMAKRAAKKGL